MEGVLNRVLAFAIGVMFLAAAGALGFVLQSWWAAPYIVAPVWLGLLLIANAFKSAPTYPVTYDDTGSGDDNARRRDASERIAA